MISVLSSVNSRIRKNRAGVQILSISLISLGVIRLSGSFMLIPVLTGLFIGPVFCGWICPMGALQDALGFIGRRLGIKEKRLAEWHKYIRISLLFLTAVSLLYIKGNNLPLPRLVEPLSPFLPAAAAVLFLISGILIPRVFCRLLCPYGGLLSLTNLIKFIPVRKNETCRECQNCTACPMDIHLGKTGTNRDLRCNGCMDCLERCDGTSLGGKRDL